MWFKKKKQQQEKLADEEKQRQIVDVVSDMVLLLEKKLTMLVVEVEAIKLRFKKKIPTTNDDMELEKIEPKDSYSNMFIPESDGGIK
ncbi:hypothetical protein ES703_92504 [subsurface metagenome]